MNADRHDEENISIYHTNQKPPLSISIRIIISIRIYHSSSQSKIKIPAQDKAGMCILTQCLLKLKLTSMYFKKVILF
ncbi:hypothetical protein DF182_13810 [Chitinophaga flava]|uniref:Uncharacterized protein n=1 Tax=Chitinophaga flava TaxID=2259036 RepID=A0A365Y4R6_9BACT|nr:hypothetical protein DF182_13810 [Chitinophaga flava]